MRCLLDTSICIALLRDSSASVGRRLAQAVARDGAVFISSLVLCELWYGVYKSSRHTENSATLQLFLRGPVEVLPFDEEDAFVAGRIGAELAQAGKTIGSYDTLIAGQCLNKQLTVVTANSAEFKRVKGLHCQDWTQ